MESSGITFYRLVQFNRGRIWCGLSKRICACAEFVQIVSFRSLSWEVHAVGLIAKLFMLPIGRVAAGTFCLRAMFLSETSPRSTAAQSLSFIRHISRVLDYRWSRPCNAARPYLWEIKRACPKLLAMR